MPTIPLNSLLGLTLDGKLAEGTGLLSALPRLPKLLNLPLDQVPLDALSAGLEFSHSESLNSDGLQLDVSAGAPLALNLIRERNRALDENDPFGEIPVQADEIYVALGLDAKISSGLSRAAGQVNFGFSLGAELTVHVYRRFRRKADGEFPAFGEALAQLRIVIPHSLTEMANPDLDTGLVVVIAGTGTLSASAGVSFATPVGHLASVPIAGITSLDVKDGASFSVSVPLELTTGFQVRVRKLDSGSVELGVYKTKSREIGLKVSAKASATASIGGFDLTERLIGALSMNPLVDVEEFRKALPGEDQVDEQGNIHRDRSREQRIDGFRETLGKAVSTKLELSVADKFSSLKSHEAAWLFEIDLAAATSDGARDAVAGALKGNFTALTQDPNDLPRGIKQTSNILTDTLVKKQTLNINLLGLLNFVSIGKLLQSTEIQVNDKGDITLITDTTKSSHLEALIANVGEDRLRHLLSENFLLQAAYQVSGLDVLPPNFTSSHSHFVVQGKTSAKQMKDNLDVARALSLVTPDEQGNFLAADGDFGRTTFYIEAKYDSDSVLRMFQNDGRPKSQDEYETMGRSSLGALLAGDEDQDLRVRYAALGQAGDDLWKRMKSAGFANLAPLFGFPAHMQPRDQVRLAVVQGDLRAILDWASAMAQTAKAIQKVRANVAAAAGPEDPQFENARTQLKKDMERVAASAGDRFGDPLGLVMVYLASGQAANVKVLMTGQVSLDRSRRKDQELRAVSGV